MCVHFSLGSGFLYINKRVCKQICPVWLQGRKDWIHAPVEAPRGGGDGRVYTRFAQGFVCLTLPSPYFFSYLGLVLSPSRLQTRMFRNSSLEPQAFVKRASTGNRLLFCCQPCDVTSVVHRWELRRLKKRQIAHLRKHTLSSDLKHFLIIIIRFNFLKALFYDWKTFLKSKRTCMAFASIAL